jgi:hypothetical protein
VYIKVAIKHFYVAYIILRDPEIAIHFLQGPGTEPSQFLCRRNASTGYGTMSFNKTINQQQNKFQTTNSTFPPAYIPLARKERLARALFALAGCSQQLTEACT